MAFGARNVPTASAPVATVASDYLTSVARGMVPGQEIVRRLGRNPDVGTTEVDVWYDNVTRVMLTAASTVTVVSSSAADSVAGTGARIVTIDGLDSMFNRVSASVNLSGTTPVATTQTFIRVLRVYVSASGTYGAANAGTITATATTGGSAQGKIAPGAATNNQSHYTVPAGYLAYLCNQNINVAASKTCDVIMWSRPNADIVTPPFSPKSIVQPLSGLTNQYTRNVMTTIPFQPKTDLWFTAVSTIAGTTAEVTAGYHLLLVQQS